MSYGSRIRPKEKEFRNHLQKAYRRESLTIWDAKWHALSIQARYFFLYVVKFDVEKRLAKPNAAGTGVSINRFPSSILKELIAAGLVEIAAARSRAFSDQAIVCDEAYDFTTRLHALQRHRLLASGKSSEFRKYIDEVFVGNELDGVLQSILRNQQILDGFQIENVIQRYIFSSLWPEWVAAALKEPLVEKILEVILQAAGPVSLVGLAGWIEGSDPAKVREVIDTLIAHLVLVEDLEPKSWEVIVGFLPTVREQLIRNRQPRERPPLQVCERPKEVGPSESVIVNDLRGVLLEIASEPPRVRQDQCLFSKEIERFQTVLEPLADWLLKVLRWTNEARVNQAIAWARALQLVNDVAEGMQVLLQLNSRGHKWLSSDLADQYQGIYNLLNADKDRDAMFTMHLDWSATRFDDFSNLSVTDFRFLGEHVTAVRIINGKRVPHYWDAKLSDHKALRASLDEALNLLKPGVYYRLDSVETHLVAREHNPLNRGLDPDQVAVFWRTRLVPTQDSAREVIGRNLINAFVRQRLIPLGCVQVAIDAEDQVCIARDRRYDAYFGREITREDWSPTTGAEARVIVQPDFSVIVIGLNPAPAADLAQFCERAATGSGQGALVLKITRDSVVKAVGLGLKPVEILRRLQLHASNGVPANVLREVEEWANWVRQITTSTLTVLRCPDQATADRVVSALKRQAERLSNTIVAIDLKKLTTIERSKLRNHGIIIQKGIETNTHQSKAKHRR
ncbi:helicase-associated domain-containing protein (plasmid) [Singulisphaera sp. Ch08]|uniref:Helicase-associated domain-containing protein n=1 Tax=Singulisphaera sp. Ch08 TaxID=3120278 RepID=A0AAU7CU34_9BACT